MSPLLALVPFQALLSFFFHVCGGWETVLPPSHSPLPRSPPFPSSPTGGKGRGRWGGGAGLPLGTAVAQSISPKPRKFLLPKRKKGKKKTPSGHLSSLPHWDSQDWICGVPGRVAQGWNTLRQEWWSSLAGPPPGPLWASPLSPLLSPPSDPPEVAFPAPGPLGYRPLHWGQVGVLHSLGEGGRWDPGSLHTMSSAHLPQSWAFPSMSCCGDICSPPQKSVPSSPTFPAKGGADPVLGEEWGLGRGLSAPRGPLGSGGTRASQFWACLSESTAPHHHHPTASPSLALIWAPFSSFSLAFSSWRCRPPLRRLPRASMAAWRKAGLGGRSRSLCPS